jgi:hypothetical protein
MWTRSRCDIKKFKHPRVKMSRNHLGDSAMREPLCPRERDVSFPGMKAYFLFAFFFFLASCTTREQRKNQAESRSTVNELEEKLRVGMSLEEVKAITSKLSDCRGSAKSYMTCEGSFMTRAGRYFPLKQQVGSGSPDTYTTYTLEFEKNQLKRWKTEDEKWAH